MILETTLIKGIFVFFRTLGVIITSPILGDRGFPATAKIALALSIAFLLTPVLNIDVPNPDSVLILILIISREILIGVAIGLVVLFIFMGVQLAGSIMGFQMGMWLAEMVDPTFGIEIPVIAQFNYLFAMMLFLCVNGHLMVLNAVRQTFKLLPLGTFSITNSFTEQFLATGSSIFRVGFEIGAPIIGVLLLISISLGLIARAIPEFDILMSSIPLSISTGLWLMSVSLPYIAVTILKMIYNLEPNIYNLFRH